MSKALKVWEQVIANNNRNDDLIEQFYFLCKEEAKQEVEERIIKLLDTLRCSANGVEHDCVDALGGYTVDDIVALIKGEQK